MFYEEPAYDRAVYNDAAKRYFGFNFSSEEEEARLLSIINNWRSIHNHPLNTFNQNIRSYALALDKNAIIGRRLKRLKSIGHKLERFENMKLTQIQDMGGCRAIMGSVSGVRKLRHSYFKSSIRHELRKEDDYINQPKVTGYRGIHLIYKFKSDRRGPDCYNGLSIELQLRTKRQHAWATAVETVGTFLEESLKSDIGDPEWLRFFSLMSSYIAIKEKCEVVPNTPTSGILLKKEIREYANALDVINTLDAYGSALKLYEKDYSRETHIALMSLVPSEQKVDVYWFRHREIDIAHELYAQLELEYKDRAGAQTVLITGQDLNNLKKAYPNYFLDTKLFLEMVREAVE